MWQSYFQPATLDETLALLAKYGPEARLINGGTDLIIEIERRLRAPAIVIDISRIAGLDEIRLVDGVFHVGPSVTHHQAVASPLLRSRAFPLVRACWEVGAPQIRNRGTIAGNVITASPANDTITPLWALGASVTLQSVRGARMVKLEEFMLGVRRTALEPDEMLTDIAFPALQENEQGTFIKLGLRRAQAISVVNVAVVLGFAANRINRARITLGAVAPTIVSATAAQQFLLGESLDEATIVEAANLAVRSARPIDDLRSTATYRRQMVQILVARALRQLRDGTECADFPERPVLLWGQTDGRFPALNAGLETHPSDVIETTVNGQRYAIREAGDKTLLRLLREDLGLIGTKEGCAEGECGACTVFLDGQAVMSCLVPAPRAHHAHIITIEGLKHDDQLHPVQQGFVETGAVQCGYCSPGFIMSGAKLLEEISAPTHAEVQQAISGNLCRCTGYYKIVEAIERAANLI